jgi:hypothetical protein
VPAENLLEYFQETDQEPPAALLEKLRLLEENLDQITLGPSRRPKASLKAEPPRETKIEEEPVEDLSDIEQLIKKAKRLKTEAVRIEQKYSVNH